MVYSFPVDRVTSFVVARKTEIDRQSPLYFGAAQWSGIFTCNGRIGSDPAAFHRQKTIERLTVRALADESPRDTVALNNMLAETEEGGVTVTFCTGKSCFAAVM